MTPQALIDIMHQALWISLLLAGPTLGFGADRRSLLQHLPGGDVDPGAVADLRAEDHHRRDQPARSSWVG